MTVSREKGALRFTSETYSLTFLNDRPFVRVESRSSERLAELFILSSIHSMSGRDDTIKVGDWEVDEQPGTTTFLLRVESSFWKAKQYRFRCFPGRFTYDVEIEGEGQL